MRKCGQRGYVLCRSCGAAAALLLASHGGAWADADGPDAWRVVDVAGGDVLNVRMWPGTEYPVIDHFAPDARGLQQVTCVPLLKAEYYQDDRGRD